MNTQQHSNKTPVTDQEEVPVAVKTKKVDDTPTAHRASSQAGLQTFIHSGNIIRR